jgi:uncharacterized membrane protein
MLNVSSYRLQALEMLSGQWSNAVVVFLVYLILGGFSALMNIPGYIKIGEALGPIYSFAILVPVQAGIMLMFLHLYRFGEPLAVSKMFEGFRLWGKLVIISVLTSLIVIAGVFLLIVPGLIWSMMYSQAVLVLLENPELTPWQAMQRSKAMMNGYKNDYARLLLSYLGWAFLSLLTLGIGFLWLQPYLFAGQVAFYVDINNRFMQQTEPAMTEEVVQTDMDENA